MSRRLWYAAGVVTPFALAALAWCVIVRLPLRFPEASR